jgi:hypothetical protein
MLPSLVTTSDRTRQMISGVGLYPRWRRWRAWLIVGIIVLLGGAGIAALHKPPANPYLNPRDVSPVGAHALADIVAGLGHQVLTTTSAPVAEREATRGSTLVITNPDFLSRTDLLALGRVRASILLVGPDAVALAAIAPPVRLQGLEPVVVTAPGCRLRAATLAGPADMGGTNLRVRSLGTGAQQCYASRSGPALVQIQLRGRTVTVLATGYPLTNARLAAQGNAALAINLLPTHRIVWLVPAVVIVAAAAGPRSFASLVPLAAYLVIIQLVVAALLAVVWRARRLGQLVAEPLPVVVRAAETTEGHGRLYQARRARAQAAEALRSATRARLERAAGVPAGSAQDAIVAALGQRMAVPAARIAELLYGPAPGNDQGLVSLARDLDQLEREAGMT